MASVASICTIISAISKTVLSLRAALAEVRLKSDMIINQRIVFKSIESQAYL
jgi:hypothetical protein